MKTCNTLSDVVRELEAQGKKIGRAAREGNTSAERVISVHKTFFRRLGNKADEQELIDSYNDYVESERTRG